MIFDLHNDFPTVLDKNDYRKFYKNVHGNAVTAALWTTEFKGDVESAVNTMVSDLRKARDGRLVYAAIEDIGFTAERDIYKKFEFGEFLYCSLTWNYNNAFAGGALDNGGLTEKGKSVIRYINDTRCALDLAHLNNKSFYRALELGKKVLCSHTGFNKNLRSLDDAQIRELISKGGIIGLCTVPAFTDANNIDEFAVVIDRFVQKYGVDNLAIGTDFYGSKDIPESMNNYRKLESVSVRLEDYGYTHADCEKILNGNAINFLN